MNIVCFILGLIEIGIVVYHIAKMKPVTHLPEDADDFLYAGIAFINTPIALILLYLGCRLSGWF